MTSLYRRVLGPSFAALPPSVQRLHSIAEVGVWRGTARVRRGTNRLARMTAAAFGLPPDGDDVALTVTFTADTAGHETWDRDFAGRRFLSVQSDYGGGIIAERVGRVTLLLRPAVDAAALTLSIEGARFFGFPLPRFVLPSVSTREFERDGRYHFDVRSELPLIGFLVHYQGTLQPVG